VLCKKISVKRISGAYQVVAFSEQEMFEKVEVLCAVFICFVLEHGKTFTRLGF